MQHGGDYGAAQYYPHQFPYSSPNNPNPNPIPNPNPTELPPSNPIPRSYASAPPYSPYSAAEFPAYSSSGYNPSYSHNPAPVPSLPPSAPSYSQPQPQFPALAPYNPPPYPAEQPPPAAPYPHLQQQQQPAPAPPSSAPAYYPYDAHQPAAANYGPPVNADPSANPNSGFSSPYGSYESTYESSAARFDHGGGGYYGENSGGYGLAMAGEYGRSRSGYEQDLYGKKPDDGPGEGVYAYDGGRLEPYGARGTAPSRSVSAPSRSSSGSPSTLFDDYGRSISFSSSGKEQVGSQPKIVRAVPKTDAQPDVKSGVQKYRVKLLPEGSGTTMDVLCQIGLDGIRMLDPSTSRTLRIYPLDTLTRWEVTDTSIFTFWSKSSVDIEPRRIRLQSSSYTTNTILDTVTAATVQLKEMGGRESLGKVKGTDSGKPSEQPSEKKKGLADWMNFIKPANVEKDHWVPDEAVNKCTSCGSDFNAFNRRHHCRNCGDIFCDKCTQGRIALTADENAQPVRVCDRCMAEVSQRLNNAKESASKPAELHSHEDLARKLQEEMDKNRKSSSGSKSPDGSGKRMREVVCPTCTVHLQVQVPASGSETIECGVCQHPFLVSAH